MFLSHLKNHINNNNINEQSLEDIFVEVAVVFQGELINFNDLIKNIGGKVLDLYQNFAIITLKLGNLEKLKYLKSIKNIKFPEEILFKSESSEMEILDYQGEVIYDKFQENNKYKLTGKGVLIGFIDSGIDFTHLAFSDLNNKTRIKYIYNIVENKIYDEVDINNAIKSKNPFQFIDERDFKGHGTAVASVAAAGGLIPEKYYGVANESNLIMVKMGREGIYQNSWELQIMKGIRFLVEKSKKLSMPLVINISLNSSANNSFGKSFLERYLTEISRIKAITIVTSIGNEAEEGLHYGAIFSEENIVNLNIGEGEREVLINLVKSRGSRVDFKIILPNKEEVHFNKDINYNYVARKNNNIEIYRTINPFDKNLEEIKIVLNAKKGFLTEGIWKIIFIDKEKSFGRFDLWLPVASSLNGETKFLEPVKENTILAPALSEGVISVGSGNLKGEKSTFSALGPKALIVEIKPNVLSIGENVIAASGSWFSYKTGTSIAAARVSAIVAVLMEWGIVKGDDKELYGRKLKRYIELAASRNVNMKYPNNEQGYGFISLSNVINLIESLED